MLFRSVWLRDISHGAAFYEDVRKNHEGTLIIFGHSSKYPWDPNPYGTLFRPFIQKLYVGDIVEVYDNGRYRAFKITSREIIQPDEMDKLRERNENIKLMLFTCDYDFTKRILWKAKEISTK